MKTPRCRCAVYDVRVERNVKSKCRHFVNGQRLFQQWHYLCVPNVMSMVSFSGKNKNVQMFECSPTKRKKARKMLNLTCFKQSVECRMWMHHHYNYMRYWHWLWWWCWGDDICLALTVTGEHCFVFVYKDESRNHEFISFSTKATKYSSISMQTYIEWESVQLSIVYA